MLCSRCNIEMFVNHSIYDVTGDNSDETATEVAVLPYCCCVNRRCSERGVLIQQPRIEIYKQGQPQPIPKMIFD